LRNASDYFHPEPDWINRCEVPHPEFQIRVLLVQHCRCRANAFNPDPAHAGLHGRDDGDLRDQHSCSGGVRTDSKGVVTTKAQRHKDFVPLWLSKREGKQRVAYLNTDVLFSIDHIRHRAGSDGWSEIRLPQQFAITSIERVERTIPAAAEEHVRCGSEDSRLC